MRRAPMRVPTPTAPKKVSVPFPADKVRFCAPGASPFTVLERVILPVPMLVLMLEAPVKVMGFAKERG